MNLKEYILTDKIRVHYHVEEDFLRALHESELIHIEIFECKPYLPISEINEFEKFRRLHYDMEINIPGLEAIQNLLETIHRLQEEKQQLQNRLRLFE